MALQIAATEDSPPDMLEGHMDLLVHLPDNSFLQYKAERSCAVMDLLVQIAAKAKLKPSDYILQPLRNVSSSSSNLSTYEHLNCKPNTPIGLLNTQMVRLIPKTETKVPKTTKAVTSLRSGRTSSQLYFDSDDDLTGATAVEFRNNFPDFHSQYLTQRESQVRSKSNYISSVLPASLSLSTETDIYQAQSYSKPFETTFRVKIHLPYNQLHVLRVTPHTPLKDIFDIVCDERNFQSHRYLFVDPGDHSNVLDLNATLQSFGGDELTLVAKTKSSSYSEAENRIQKDGRKLQKWSKFSLPSFLKKKDKSNKHTYNMDTVSSANTSSIASQRSLDDLASTNRMSHISGRMPIGRSQSSVETRLNSKWPSAYGIDENEDPEYITTNCSMPKNNEKITGRITVARKKRPAPPPPSKPVILGHNENIQASIKNESNIKDRNMPDMEDVQEVLDNKNPSHDTHVAHSRNSSDSSGYHDSGSVLSYGGIGLTGSCHYNYGSAPATFPRKIKIPTEMELAKYHDENMHFKTNTAVIEGKVPKISPRKKKVAPIPPLSTEKKGLVLLPHSHFLKHDVADLDIIMESSGNINKAEDHKNTPKYLKEETYEMESTNEPPESNKTMFESQYASIPVEANSTAKHREIIKSKIEYFNDEPNKILEKEIHKVANGNARNASHVLSSVAINSPAALINNFPNCENVIQPSSDTCLSENNISYSEMNTPISSVFSYNHSVDALPNGDSSSTTTHTATVSSMNISLSESTDSEPLPDSLHKNSSIDIESTPSNREYDTFINHDENNLLSMPSTQTFLSSPPLTASMDITLENEYNNTTNLTKISSTTNTISSISTTNALDQHSDHGISEEVTLRNKVETKSIARYSISSTASDPPLLADLDGLSEDTKIKKFETDGCKSSAESVDIDSNLSKKKIIPIPPPSTEEKELILLPHSYFLTSKTQKNDSADLNIIIEPSGFVNKADDLEITHKYLKKEAYEMESADELSESNKATFESPYAIPVEASLTGKYRENNTSGIEYFNDEKVRVMEETVHKDVNGDARNVGTMVSQALPSDTINSPAPLVNNFSSSENNIQPSSDTYLSEKKISYNEISTPTSPAGFSCSHSVNTLPNGDSSSTVTHTTTVSSVNASLNSKITDSVFPPDTYLNKKSLLNSQSTPMDDMISEDQDKHSSNVIPKIISLIPNSLSSTPTNGLEQNSENGNSKEVTLRNVGDNKLKTRISMSSTSDPPLLTDQDVSLDNTKKKDFRTHRRQNSASYLVNTLDRINNPQSAATVNPSPVFVPEVFSLSVEKDAKNETLHSIEPPKRNSITLATNPFKATIDHVVEKEAVDKELPPEMFKKTSYQGPPEVKFGTWNERPKKYVALKSDSDYKISAIPNRSDVEQIKRNISMVDDRSVRTDQKNGNDNKRHNSMNRNSLPSSVYRQISLVPTMKSSQKTLTEVKQLCEEAPFGQNTLRKTGFRKIIIEDALNINSYMSSYSAPVLGKDHSNSTDKIANEVKRDKETINDSSPRNSIVKANIAIPKKHDSVIISQIPMPPKFPKSNLSTKENTLDPRSMLLEQIKNASNLSALKKTNLNK